MKPWIIWRLFSLNHLCFLIVLGIDFRWSIALWFFIQWPLQAAETSAQKRWQFLQQKATFGGRTRWTTRQKTLCAKQRLRWEKLTLPCPTKFIAREASHRASRWVKAHSAYQLLSESSRHTQRSCVVDRSAETCFGSYFTLNSTIGFVGSILQLDKPHPC